LSTDEESRSDFSKQEEDDRDDDNDDENMKSSDDDEDDDDDGDSTITSCTESDLSSDDTNDSFDRDRIVPQKFTFDLQDCETGISICKPKPISFKTLQKFSSNYLDIDHSSEGETDDEIDYEVKEDIEGNDEVESCSENEIVEAEVASDECSDCDASDEDEGHECDSDENDDKNNEDDNASIESVHWEDDESLEESDCSDNEYSSDESSVSSVLGEENNSTNDHINDGAINKEDQDEKDVDDEVSTDTEEETDTSVCSNDHQQETFSQEEDHGSDDPGTSASQRNDEVEVEIEWEEQLSHTSNDQYEECSISIEELESIIDNVSQRANDDGEIQTLPDEKEIENYELQNNIDVLSDCKKSSLKRTHEDDIEDSSTSKAKRICTESMISLSDEETLTSYHEMQFANLNTSSGEKVDNHFPEALSKLKSHDVHSTEVVHNPIPLLTPPMTPVRLKSDESVVEVCELPYPLPIESAFQSTVHLRSLSPPSISRLDEANSDEALTMTPLLFRKARSVTRDFLN
jgi:hypothetical protein